MTKEEILDYYKKELNLQCILGVKPDNSTVELSYDKSMLDDICDLIVDEEFDIILSLSDKGNLKLVTIGTVTNKEFIKLWIRNIDEILMRKLHCDVFYILVNLKKKLEEKYNVKNLH